MKVKCVDDASRYHESGMRSETKREYTARVEEAIAPIRSGEDASSVEELADKAAFSRFHFQRLFKSVMGETPGELRRRLLLERAAWRLRAGDGSVTEIAFDAEFKSLEGFIRAFGKAFGLSPSRYRRFRPAEFRLAAENGVHYSPTTGALPMSPVPKGEKAMDLVDRLLDHDLWLVRQMLEKCKSLTNEQLDASLLVPSNAITWEKEQNSLRDLLDRIVFAKEVWVAAMEKQEFPSAERARTVDGLIARLEIAYPTFIGLAKRVRDQGKWDETFVDALCEPPETFTFGGMFAHVATFGIFRRQLALEEMRKMGVTDLGYGDPIEWERGLA